MRAYFLEFGSAAKPNDRMVAKVGLGSELTAAVQNGYADSEPVVRPLLNQSPFGLALAAKARKPPPLT